MGEDLINLSLSRNLLSTLCALRSLMKNIAAKFNIILWASSSTRSEVVFMSVAPGGQLPSSLFKSASPVSVCRFAETRELIESHNLQAGEYLIIPCTIESNMTASFIITTYSKEPVKMVRGHQ
ncbi:hypothetical protein XENOCAPTIV_007908 [Xenoophorus captivus]|uniref:Peptidase C2 calpain large subunit domain-containing protein n=1 Tax=Xenoophorus captivus TaxID=1517983 RepID=A0ABV0RZ89_9TELE